jgi:hypothetical protein
MCDFHQHSRTDEDLPRLGFVAEARADLRHRAESGVVELALKPNGAKRSEAVRNADAKANVVSEAATRRSSCRFNFASYCD